MLREAVKVEERKCPECDVELEQTYFGRYNCPKCGGTYWESDFIENEGGLNENNKKNH